MEEFLNEILNLNPNDKLYIDEKIFFESLKIKNIISKYGFEETNKIRIFILAITICKFNNTNVNYQIKRHIDRNKTVTYIDDMIFYNLRNIKEEYIKHYCSIVINYLVCRINSKQLQEFIDILNSINLKNIDFIFPIEEIEGKFVDYEDGEELLKSGLVDKDENQDIRYQYKLNNRGELFLDIMYLDVTSKEKSIYSKMIDLDKMGELKPVLEHKKYYDEIVMEIGENENIKKTARLQEATFKCFFEEYYYLIEYAFAKYGENCLIKFCGKDTGGTIKYDGFIKNADTEEKVEIVSTFADKEQKDEILQLNRKGIGKVKLLGNKLEYEIQNEVKKQIAEKNANKKGSYDNTISLLVTFNNHILLTSKQIQSEEFWEELFSNLRNQEYIFKEVTIIVDKYNGSDKSVNSRIIKIK